MNIKNLKTYFIYINKENSILQIKEESIPCIQSSELCSVVPKMNIINQIQRMKKDKLGCYVLSSMAIHHVVINDNSVSDYVANKITHHSFFREI